MESATEWQARTLEKIYPIIFFDAIRYKLKENGESCFKSILNVFGVLGIWIGDAEGARFWLKGCTELQNRCEKNVLIACLDGLKALPDATRMVFPEVEIHLCKFI